MPLAQIEAALKDVSACIELLRFTGTFLVDGKNVEIGEFSVHISEKAIPGNRVEVKFRLTPSANFEKVTEKSPDTRLSISVISKNEAIEWNPPIATIDFKKLGKKDLVLRGNVLNDIDQTSKITTFLYFTVRGRPSGMATIQIPVEDDVAAVHRFAKRIKDWVKNEPAEVAKMLGKSGLPNNFVEKVQEAFAENHPDDPIDVYIPIDQLRRDLRHLPRMTQDFFFDDMEPHYLEKENLVPWFHTVLAGAIQKTLMKIEKGTTSLTPDALWSAIEKFNHSNSFGVHVMKRIDFDEKSWNYPNPFYGFHVASKLEQMEATAHEQLKTHLTEGQDIAFWSYFYTHLHGPNAKQIFLEEFLITPHLALGDRIVQGLNSLPEQYTYSEVPAILRSSYILNSFKAGGQFYENRNSYLEELESSLETLGLGKFRLDPDTRKFSFNPN